MHSDTSSLEHGALKRLYPDQPVVGVGAIVLQEGKILLEKRMNQPAKKQWTIPGGVVEVGESVLKTRLSGKHERKRAWRWKRPASLALSIK